ncbi:glycerophosphodiester phosphodiesterase [Staphylococcus microti]|uniref:Glycerophosphodiester phosphodiesterase n=1 Tax=Staphylococcus microti TaxID=569857 RepID=A0A0D6XQG8_9STAP|nr:glycerophosphodiester phosphodiesterase family protein [Staphylococcus microti]KIX90088.1 glycerophosphodiester phosphodiesterase [Staphylococcus microti]PNZ76952.1 glycerophosphodiester phosphodiesterase [Staphylococcus microti]SUM57750.1 glycerophosphoryl diester phosphodiesterase [Staphylococcus microti]
MKLARPSKAFKVIAHRGLSQQYPENTKRAYQAALSQHIDMLEIDLHMTKDGVLVGIHDDTIDRTSNGKGAIKELTLEALRSFNFSRQSDFAENVSIMTFDEILTLCKNYSKTLLIEVKKPKNYPNIGEQIIQKLKNHAFPTNRVIIQSFDQTFIQQMAEIVPYMHYGVLISKRKYWLKQPTFSEIAKYADYVNPNYQLINKKFIARAHAVGLKIMPYTVNDSQTAKKLIQLGVDGVITDIPDEIFKL